MSPRRIIQLLLLSAAMLPGCSAAEEPGTPAELVERGWREFRLDEYASAERCFSTALRRLAGEAPPQAPQLRASAAYGLGMIESLGRRTDAARVRELFQNVIAQDPKGEFAPWAALAIVRHKHIPPRSDAPVPVEELKSDYLGIATKYPGTAAAAEARVFRVTLFVQSLQEEDARTAISEIDAYLPELRGVAYRAPLLSLRSRAYETLRDYPKALESSIAALEAKELDPTNPNMNNILEYYRIGMMAMYDVGDFETARRYFRRFLQEYGRDQRSFIVQRELERMDVIERAGGDVSAAGSVGLNPPGVGGLPPREAR